jgi:Rps23 Pro-64 3,4-dihydroxylase Tpa1-like proline 4-hydroxylase
MKLVKSHPNFAIFDDFLSEKDFGIVLNYLCDEEYKSVHAKKWRKVYRISDGNPLEGIYTYVCKANEIERQKLKKYSCHEGINTFIKRFSTNICNFNQWIGTRDIDWKLFTVKPYLFPQGAGLSWHDDSSGKTGSYIFYAHSHWNVQWGGELFVAESSHNEGLSKNMHQRKFSQHLCNTDENDRLLQSAWGYYISPKPNRIVVMSSEVDHKINHVKPTAGDNVRLSIAGFFLKDDPSL